MLAAASLRGDATLCTRSPFVREKRITRETELSVAHSRRHLVEHNSPGLCGLIKNFSADPDSDEHHNPSTITRKRVDPDCAPLEHRLPGR